MEAERRKLKRKPLSDCTNISASLSRPSKTASNPKKKPDENSVKHDTSTGSNNAQNPSILSQPCTPPRKRSAASVTADENLKTATVYHRRRSVDGSKDKGKQVMVDKPVSCPPARRIRNLGDDLISKRGSRNERYRGMKGVIFSDTDPPPKKNKRFSRAEKHALPQDFIEKQKAYFAEVDAFELPEEVVSSESELE